MNQIPRISNSPFLEAVIPQSEVAQPLPDKLPEENSTARNVPSKSDHPNVGEKKEDVVKQQRARRQIKIDIMNREFLRSKFGRFGRPVSPPLPGFLIKLPPPTPSSSINPSVPKLKFGGSVLPPAVKLDLPSSAPSFSIGTPFQFSMPSANLHSVGAGLLAQIESKFREKVDEMIDEHEEEIKKFRQRAAENKWRPWLVEYEIARMRERWEWDNFLEGGDDDRGPRLQKLEEYKQRLDREWKANAAKAENEAINKLKQHSIAHNWIPWYAEYEIANVREQCGWNYFEQYHNVPREPRLQRLAELKQRLEREYNERSTKELTQKIEAYKAKAAAEKWAVLFHKPDIDAIQEAHEWEHYTKYQNVSREPRLQKLLDDKIKHVREGLTTAKWDSWAVEYEIEVTKERHEWEYKVQYQQVSRAPRWQKLLETKIRLFREWATAAKWMPWVIEHEIEKIKEGHEWWTVVDRQNVPREPRLQRLAELKQRLEREYNERLQALTDLVGHTIHQEWYQVGDTSPGAYPRSLKQYTDQRGLVTKLKYDTKGNVTEKTILGDITGDGVSDTATTKFAYNDKNLLTSVTEASGNEVAIFYEDNNNPQLPTRIERKFQGQVVFDIRNTYTAGLLQRQTIAAETPDEATVECKYNEKGLPVSQRRIIGNSDPDVVTQFEYNPRGELTKQIDDSGISIYIPDLANKQIRVERRDKAGNLLASQTIQYHDNGKIKQIEQYYPGATGTEIAERSPDAITYQHDHSGNLVEVKRPNSHPVKMTYDGMGRMLTRSYQDDADSSKLYTEKFTYGPGGEIAAYTNPQGGETKYFYTTDGKLRRQENPDGTVQQWRYGLDGRLTKEILPDGTYWETTYQDTERRINRILKNSVHQPLSQESYSLDRRGNVTSYTDGTDCVVFYSPSGLVGAGIATEGINAPELSEEGLLCGQPQPGTIAFLSDLHHRLIPSLFPGILLLGNLETQQDRLHKGIITLTIASHSWKVFSTEERARWNDQGQLVLISQPDTSLPEGFTWTKLRKIEEALTSHPDLIDAIVRKSDDLLCAWIVPRDSHAQFPAALENHLRDHLPKNWIPTQFAFVTRFNLTAFDQIDAEALPQPAPPPKSKIVTSTTIPTYPESSPNNISPIITLRAGIVDTALYFVHAGRGLIEDYQPVVQALSGGYAVHCLMVPRGRLDSSTTVEEITRQLLPNFRRHVNGKFAVVGIGTGAVFAWELARQLDQFTETDIPFILFEVPPTGRKETFSWLYKLRKTLLGNDSTPYSPHGRLAELIAAYQAPVLNRKSYFFVSGKADPEWRRRAPLATWGQLRLAGTSLLDEPGEIAGALRDVLSSIDRIDRGKKSSLQKGSSPMPVKSSQI